MEISNDLLNKIKESYISYKDLPFGVYTVMNHDDKPPQIIDYNEFAELTLNIKKNNTLNILDYYVDKKSRIDFIDDLSKQENESWSTYFTIPFYIDHGNYKQEQLTFKVKIFKENEKVVGLLTLIIFKDRVHNLDHKKYNFPLGYFEIHKRTIMSFCNKKTISILELGKDERDFDIIDKAFLSEEQFVEIDTLLNKSDDSQIQKSIAVRVSKNKVKILKLYIYRENQYIYYIDTKNSNIFKTQTHGYIEDITFFSENQYTSNILISNIDSKYIIHNFDKNFEEWFLNKINIGDNFINYIEVNEHKYFHNFINKNIDKCIISVMSTGGRYECSKKKFENYFIITLIKIDDKLKNRLDNWKEVMSAILHSYKNSFGFTRRVIQNVLKTHEGNGVILKRDELNHIEDLSIDLNYIKKVLKDEANNLTLKTKRFLDDNYEISENTLIEELLNDIKGLIYKSENEEFVSFISELRSNVFELKEHLYNSINLRYILTEKDIQRHFTTIFRYSRLYSLDLILKDNIEMIEETNAIDLIFHDIVEEPRIEFNLLDELWKVKINLDSYGEFRGIKIRIKIQDDLGIKKPLNRHLKVLIQGQAISLNTALHNIVHNAIKYSWIGIKKDVRILLVLKERILQVEVSNYGVGIPENELAKIKDFGVRGSSARDREKKRPGSGIGLWYANEKIKEFKGSIDIVSKPLNNYNQFNLSKTLHLTTVKITLPYLWQKFFG